MRWLITVFLVTSAAVPFYIDVEVADGARINLQRTLLLLLILGNIAMLMVNKPVSRRLAIFVKREPVLSASLLGYSVWIVFSAALSGSLSAIFIALNEVASGPMFFFIVAILLFSYGYFKPPLKPLLVACIFVFVFALVEVVIGRNIFAEIFAQGRGGTIGATEITRNGLLRVKSTFEHPLTLAHFTLMTTPLLLPLVQPRFGPRISLYAYLGLGLIVLFLTGSRSGILIAALLLFFGYVVQQKLSRSRATSLPAWVLVVPLIAAFGVVVMVAVLQRSGAGGLTSYTREAQIVNAKIAIANRPWFGTGTGRASSEALYNIGLQDRNAIRLWEANSQTIDNRFVSNALNFGIPALLFNLTIFFLSAWKGTKFWMNRMMREKMRACGMEYVFLGYYISFLGGFCFLFAYSIFTVDAFLYFSMAGMLSAMHFVRFHRVGHTKRVYASRPPAARNAVAAMA